MIGASVWENLDGRWVLLSMRKEWILLCVREGIGVAVKLWGILGVLGIVNWVREFGALCVIVWSVWDVCVMQWIKTGCC